jgi:hypothetical protein
VAARHPQATRAWAANAALASAALACALLGPRLVDAYAELQWVRYHASRGAAAREPQTHLRAAARHAARALDLMAPLPWAGEAAGLALDLGRRLEGRQDPAVRTLYAEVCGALERARASRWRGVGLAGVTAEAERLEQALRQRAETEGP